MSRISPNNSSLKRKYSQDKDKILLETINHFSNLSISKKSSHDL